MVDTVKLVHYHHGMRTIRQIIAAAGGETAINRAIGRRRAASKWPRVGIPDRYWRTLMEMVPGLTPDELLAANSATRGEAAMNGSPGQCADGNDAACNTPTISREDAA